MSSGASRIGAGAALALACWAGPTRAASPDCGAQVDKLLERREKGDSSANLLSELSRSLECAGRTEEALGATYMPTGRDTTGRIGLLALRADLLRELGLPEVARQTEMEIGAATVTEVAEPSTHWVWDQRPAFASTLAWIDQVDHPRTAILPLRYQGFLSPDSALRRTSGSQATDSILLEGGTFQASANLSWGGWSELGGFGIGPSGSIALPDDSTGWRSASAGADLNAVLLPSTSTSLSLGISASRSWFHADGGPMPVQDEFVASLLPTWKTGRWTFTFPQSMRTQRTNSDPWAWSGSHGAGATIAPVALWKLSASASLSWFSDPSVRSDAPYTSQLVLEGKGLAAGDSLYSSTRTELALAMEMLSSIADTSQMSWPLSRSQSWIQPGLGLGTTLGPWHDVVVGASVGWSQTRFTTRQEGWFVDPLDAASEFGYVVVLRDSTDGHRYVVRSTTRSDAPVLVPLDWSLRRRDDSWSMQLSLSWRPRKWANLRAAWSRTRNTSNLEEYVDGSSYVRDVVSLSGSASW